MSEESAFEGVHEHFQTLTRVVNQDVLYLRGAVAALVIRAVETGLWAAFEVYVEDMFVAVCSELAPQPEQLPNVRVSLPMFMTMDDEERWRYIWNRGDFVKGEGVDRYDDALRKIGVSVDLERLRSSEQDVDPCMTTRWFAPYFASYMPRGTRSFIGAA